jgi:hypothetical protein
MRGRWPRRLRVCELTRTRKRQVTKLKVKPEEPTRTRSSPVLNAVQQTQSWGPGGSKELETPKRIDSTERFRRCSGVSVLGRCRVLSISHCADFVVSAAAAAAAAARGPGRTRRRKFESLKKTSLYIGTYSAQGLSFMTLRHRHTRGSKKNQVQVPLRVIASPRIYSGGGS